MSDVSRLRRDAFWVIREDNLRKLQAILTDAKDPRLLDIPASDEKHRRESLLEWCIRCGAINCARLLIETGADPMQSRMPKGLLSVHLWASHANPALNDERSVRDFMQLLSAAGADFDAKTVYGWTPLHYAIYFSSPNCSQMLIERGAWIDPKLLEDSQLPDKLKNRAESVKALRLVRSMALEQSILSALSAEGGPPAKSSPAMTL